MMIKRVIFQIAVISFFAVNISANSLVANKYPFGLPSRSTSASSMFMGGTSVGLPDAHNVLIANPGNLGQISTTAFSALLNIDYIRIKDGSRYSDMLNTFPGMFAFSLPVGRFGTLGFGMSKDNVLNIRSDSKVEPLTGDTTRVSNHVTGGTNSWEFGYGYAPIKPVSFGISVQRIYYRKDDTFLQELNNIPISRDSTSVLLRTYGLTIGYMGTFKNLTAGISYRHIFENDGRKKSNYYNYASNGKELSNPIDSLNHNLVKGKVKMPSELSFGVSYKINKSLTAAADLSMELWQQFEDKSSVVSDANSSYTKESAVSTSLGLNFIPKPNLLYPKYWETINYIVGFRYNQMPNNNDFEIAGSGGLAFPLRNAGQLEFGFEAGSRVIDSPPAGSSEYKENFVSIMFGLSGGKRWKKSVDGTY